WRWGLVLREETARDDFWRKTPEVIPIGGTKDWTRVAVSDDIRTAGSPQETLSGQNVRAVQSSRGAVEVSAKLRDRHVGVGDYSTLRASSCSVSRGEPDKMSGSGEKGSRVVLPGHGKDGDGQTVRAGE